VGLRKDSKTMVVIVAGEVCGLDHGREGSGFEGQAETQRKQFSEGQEEMAGKFLPTGPWSIL